MPYKDPEKRKAKQSEYVKRYFETEKGKAALDATQRRTHNKGVVWVYEYLKAHSCVDCGETDPVVLEFDHRDPLEKFQSVAFLAGHHYSIKKIQAEVAKCDVRCANCHRKRTAKQFGWYILQLIDADAE